jgi:formylglycine-generating enzyme
MTESLAMAIRRALVLSVVLEAACGGSHAGGGTGGNGGGGSGGGGASGGSGGGGSGGTSGGGASGTGGPDASSDGKSGAGGGSGADGATSDAGAGEQPPSCAPGGPGLGNCGASHESCCTSLPVAGGAYARTYDFSADGSADASPDAGAGAGTDPATVTDFRLDKYDVTVGRFRQFVSAVSSADGGVGWRPPPGTGKHAHLNGGLGLSDVGAPADAGVTHEPGWVATGDSNVVPTDANLSSCGANSTWTAAPGARENLPINCVTWWEAYAFCIWDGGFLPSESEWEYAAAGGSRQLPYPWGATDPGKANRYAIYDCDYPDGSGICASVSNIAPVGTATAGAGAWGQLDLAGNLGQWNLDWYAAYVSPCTDCARATKGSSRVLRGGAFGDAMSNLQPTYRTANDPALRNDFAGIRCARSP